MSSNGTQTTIQTRDEFFQPQRPKTFTVNLPDMGKTVHLLKATWRLTNALKEVAANNDGSGSVAFDQVALILATPEGELICQEPSDIERLRDIMTVDDIRLILDSWTERTAMTKAVVEETVKN